jgi:uroporphyrinogen decarboxylase
MNRLLNLATAGRERLALPILTFPGTQLAGVSVRDMVTRADAQVAAVTALHARYPMRVVLSAMDLSAEAGTFGGEVHLADNEVPTVLGRRVRTRSEAEALELPAPGAGRTAVYLETVRRLRQLPGHPCVLGGMIGPFSLAARLFGVSEMLGLTLEDPDLTHLLVAKAATFLAAYAMAFRETGADGVVMAEPTAGLLSPRALGEFSSAYVNRIVAAVDAPDFTLILHNCAARLMHLPQVLASGARAYHFGAPMDLPAALGQVTATTLICGNLDPAKVFVQSTPEQVRAATRALRAATDGRPNHVLSSGCDIPPQTPLENLDAFFAATA